MTLATFQAAAFGFGAGMSAGLTCAKLDHHLNTVTWQTVAMPLVVMIAAGKVGEMIGRALYGKKGDAS